MLKLKCRPSVTCRMFIINSDLLLFQCKQPREKSAVLLAFVIVLKSKSICRADGIPEAVPQISLW